MNATLPHAPRAVAAAALAFALALLIALVAPAVIDDLGERLGDRTVSASAPSPSLTAPSPTWAQDPLASPSQTLREVPR